VVQITPIEKMQKKQLRRHKMDAWEYLETGPVGGSLGEVALAELIVSDIVK